MHALRFGLFRVRSPLLTESRFVFSSSGYLDVSVHRVPFHTLWIGVWIHEGFSCRFPHSDICGSLCICHSPQLFAAYHVFRRLLVPRHPPCALISLTIRIYSVRYLALGFVLCLFIFFEWITLFLLDFTLILGCLVLFSESIKSLQSIPYPLLSDIRFCIRFSRYISFWLFYQPS